MPKPEGGMPKPEAPACAPGALISMVALRVKACHPGANKRPGGVDRALGKADPWGGRVGKRT